MSKTAITFLLLSFSIVCWPLTALRAEPLQKVLLLHSYHSGYQWTDDITNAVQQRFSRLQGVDLRVEYLDTKRYSSPPVSQIDI